LQLLGSERRGGALASAPGHTYVALRQTSRTHSRLQTGEISEQLPGVLRGISYVEQARIVRVGLGGLDGETGRALGEEELPAASRISSSRTENGGGDSRRKLLRPRSHYQRRLLGLRPALLNRRGERKEKKKTLTWPQPKQIGEMTPRTVSCHIFPDADPFLAFCVRCGDKANADRAGATAVNMDVRRRQAFARRGHYDTFRSQYSLT
jgi:hypothetical protein